jgi:PAS domain S-box-containing protein
MDKKNPSSNISISVLKSILNNMDAYLYVTDPETDELLFINDRMKELFNAGENPIGKRCWKVMRNDMTSRCPFCPINKLNKNPEKPEVWEIDNPITERIYKCTDSFIQWTGNRLVHLNHAVDVTEEKNAERNVMERLQQQELMTAMSQSFISPESIENNINNALKMAGEFMHVSFITLLAHNAKEQLLILKNSWTDGECQLPCNSMPFHEGILGYDSFITNHLSDIVFDDISEVEHLTNFSKCGVKALIQIPLIVEDVFWGILAINECRSTRIWNESDIQLVCLISSLITSAIEQFRMEKQYLQMANIVNTSPQFVSTISANGAFEFLNEGALDILGYSADELVGKNISLTLSEQDFRRSVDEIIPLILKEGKLDFELPIIRKDGKVRIMAMSGFKSNFNTLGINTIAVDITERKRLEKKLIIAMEQAETSNKAKSEFLSRMSHEMRTPMNAIIGMTNIAKSSNDPEKKEYCLEKIDDASNHLLGVINDILDMSKIEAGKLELFETEFLFEKMLIRVIDVVKFRIDENKQHLVMNIDPAISNFVLADEQRVAQVLTNLLSNAVKFTPEDGTITVSVKNLNYADDYILKRVTITDTGIGISKEQQENLFQSFEQADGSISRKFGGTGLGLVISKKIIELMNGTITIESELGKGASFIVDVPVKKGKQDRRTLLNPAINWKALRIFAVDDDPYETNYFRGLANDLGMFCDTAENEDETLTKIENSSDHPFDIIYINLHMPNMSGIKLAKKLLNHNISSRIVLMSYITHWNEDVEQKAAQAGVDGFFSKPLFSSQIINNITYHMLAEKDSATSLKKEDLFQGIFSGLKILLAEDIEINREIVISLLESTGVVIDSAENGLEAIKLFQENPFAYHAILMDIHMPKMDGFEATQKIRQLNLGNSKDIPIIAMTANVFKEDIEKCLAAGMNDHVGKPLDIDDLRNKLKKYLLHE